MKLLLGKTWRIIKQPHWLYLTIITFFIYAVVCYASAKSIQLPYFHVDGAFQTAATLFRFLNGELPGRDFYPYLGIGPIGLIYPIFLLGGSNLSASVFASNVVTLLAATFSVAILIHLIFKPKTFLCSAVNACGLFSVSALLMLITSPIYNKYQIPYWFSAMLEPGNSLRPVRGFIVYAAIFALYLFVFPEKNMRRKYTFYGITIAIVSLWSNDYALLTMAAVFFLSLASFIKDSHTHFLKTCGSLILVSIVSVVLMQWLITGGHPLTLARYNFIDVARDQWWYFPPWDSVSRGHFSPRSIVFYIGLIIKSGYAHYVLAASFAAIFIFKRLRCELLLVFVIGLLSAAGGTVASVGGHITGYYFDGFFFWSKVVIFLFCARLIISTIFTVLKGHGRTFSYICIIFFCALLVGINVFYAHKSLVSKKSHMQNDPTFFFVPELGGYLESNGFSPDQRYIDFIRAHKDKTTVEEYFGIWSAVLKKNSIWPVDSAIHALGDTRRTAEKALREKADIVVTSSRWLAEDWLSWSQSTNYWLYKILLESYTPTFYTMTTIVWEKDKPRPSGKSIACKIDASKDRIYLDAPNIGYYEVQLKINIERLQNNRYLMMFENNMNFITGEIGKIPLSPYDKNPIFPIYVSNKESADFGFEIRPVDTVRVSIESCIAKEIPFKNERVLLMSEGVEGLYAKEAVGWTVYSDPNFWDRGIATNRAGFYVFKDKKNLADFTVGRVVELPNKEKRIITETIGSYTPFHQVYIDGAILNAKEVGSPIHFRLLEDDKRGSLAIAMGEQIFITVDRQWRNGIWLLGPGFIVPNTEENRRLFAPGNGVQIPNTEDRSIVSTTEMGVCLKVVISGPALVAEKVGQPSKFKAIEVRPSVAPVSVQSGVNANKIDVAQTNAIKDNFFLTDGTWINGVNKNTAAFFVKNTADNRHLFVVGNRVKIPHTSEREITNIVFNGIYIEVYVTGDVMDGSRVGLPSGFKVVDEHITK